MSSNKPLTVLGHLDELRQRLIYCAIAFVIATGVSFFFADRIFEILVQPAQGAQFVYIELTEMMGTYMKVCLFSGLVLSAPFIILQLILFVTPALTRKEKKYLYLILPWVCLMFLGGVIFGYFVLLPPALNILTTFGSNIATPQIRIGNYISTVTRLLLAIGIIFELPVISTFLARLGLIKSEWLGRYRKWAIVGAFIVGAVITPTFDPINQTLVAIPLYILYEMSIWLAKLVQPRRAREASTEYSGL